MDAPVNSAITAIRAALAGCSRDWWRRYRLPAGLLIAAVGLHVLVLTVAMGWNVLESLKVIAASCRT